MNEDYSGLIYQPPPPKPFDFDAQWREIVGIHPATGEPPLRVVWGMDAKRVVAGVEEVWYIDPNGVYVGWPYLIVEAWTSPEVYDREEWELDRYEGHLDVLGPFPEKGVWDYLKSLRYDDMTPAPWQAAYDVAREWRYNATRPNAARRAVEQQRHFMAERAKKKNEAMELHRQNVLAELEREFAKPDLEPVMSLPAGRPELKNLIIPYKSAKAMPHGLDADKTVKDGN